jgi:hypothetical protein
MKFIKSLFIAAALVVPSFALAQTQVYWSPVTGFYSRDGGNDTIPTFPIATGPHDTACINFTAMGATTSFTANWGAVVNSAIVGNDCGFTVNFYTPASGQGAIAAQAALFVINLSQPFSPTLTIPDGGATQNIAISCSYAGPSGGTPGVSPYYALETSSTSLTLYNGVTFTPAASTNYHYQCIVKTAGAAF